MISLDDEEKEASCYDKVIGACNCCSGKCSNNEQPAEAIELSELAIELSEIIHSNHQNAPLEEAASLLPSDSGSPDKVGDVVMVDENSSIVKGNVTLMLTIY